MESNKENVNMSYASYVLSGAAFKLLFFLRELTFKRKKVEGFDGWITMSYAQLREKSGVTHVQRTVEELKQYSELIDISTGEGVSNRYKLSEKLL